MVSIYEKGDKTDYSELMRHTIFVNHIKNFSNILLSRLTPNAEEIIEDHQ